MSARRRPGITLKLTLILFLFASVVLVGVGVLFYRSGRGDLETATISELLSTASEKESALNAWVDNKRDEIMRIVYMRHFVTDLDALMNAAHGVVPNPDNIPPGGSVNEGLVREDLAEQTGAGKPFNSLEVIDPQTGRVIIATDPNAIGVIKADQPYFINGKSGPFVESPAYSVDSSKPVLVVAAPITSSDGRLLGVLAGVSDLDGLNEIMGRRSGLHQTDEAYLIDASYWVVTQPRLLTNASVLHHVVETDTERLCVAHNSGVQFADDYRSVPSILVYRWLSSRQLCLIVKLDQSEAFASINRFGQTVLLISILTLGAATALALGISRTLTQPILALRNGAMRLGQGELQVRLPEASHDELGELAHEFNAMAVSLAQKDDALRQANAELEKQVQERLISLHESEIELRALLAAMTDVILVIDSQGVFRRIVLTKSLLRYKLPMDVIGKAVHDIFSEPQANAFLTDIRYSLSTTQSLDREYNFVDPDSKEEIWLSLTISPMSDETVLCVARDVTDRMLMEDELQNTVRDLLRSNEELEQFAYIASHDLQEPLRMVISYMELLSRRYQGKLDEQADKYIAYAVDGASRMQQLIRDLLAYSRVATQEKELILLDSNVLLKSALQNLKVTIEESGTSVTFDSLPAIKGDEIQLSQLFQNIIGNAIKFRSEALPQIHISARNTAYEWIFSIRDNGIGIAPEYAERIFVIFKRLHTRQEYPGTGLGLAICKKIVERHGGRIWVESQIGNGSTFYFSLPVVE